jgi:hypothetical protein
VSAAVQQGRIALDPDMLSRDRWDTTVEPVTPQSARCKARIAKDRATVAHLLARRVGAMSDLHAALGLDEPRDILDFTAGVAQLEADAEDLMGRIRRLEGVPA